MFFLFDALRGCTVYLLWGTSGRLTCTASTPRSLLSSQILHILHPFGSLRVYISTKFCMVEIRDTTSCRQQYYSLYLEIGHTIGLASDASPCLSNPVRRFHFYSCTPPTSSLEHCVQSQFMNENHRKHLRHTIELTAKFEGMAGNDFFLYYSLNLAVNSAYSPNIHLCASASRPRQFYFLKPSYRWWVLIPRVYLHASNQYVDWRVDRSRNDWDEYWGDGYETSDW